MGLYGRAPRHLGERRVLRGVRRPRDRPRRARSAETAAVLAGVGGPGPGTALPHPGHRPLVAEGALPFHRHGLLPRRPRHLLRRAEHGAPARSRALPAFRQGPEPLPGAVVRPPPAVPALARSLAPVPAGPFRLARQPRII